MIGSSTGYGLSSRIAAAFGSDAATIGVFFEKSAETDRCGTAGWYNSAAFEKEAKADKGGVENGGESGRRCAGAESAANQAALAQGAATTNKAMQPPQLFSLPVVSNSREIAPRPVPSPFPGIPPVTVAPPVAFTPAGGR